MLNHISQYCIDLFNENKKKRQLAYDQLMKSDEGMKPVLEKIIVTENSKAEKNWILIMGALSILNQSQQKSTHTVVRRYQDDLTWLPEHMGRTDLHVHTNLSDGTLSVFELIQEAVKGCIKVFSICDHNTMDGIGIVQNIGSKYGIRVIPGCEFSTHYNMGSNKNPDWYEIHISGYFLDPDSTEVDDLMMWAQRRIQLRDILIAHEFLTLHAEKYNKNYGRPKDILDIIIEANQYYCEILKKNKLSKKAEYIENVIQEVQSIKSDYRISLAKLLDQAARSSQYYQFTIEEEELLKKLIHFSGYMIDHAMNKYYNDLTRKDYKNGNWFSEIKKRQGKYMHCLPKISPEKVIQDIINLGGMPVLSHPTWYPVLWYQKSRKKMEKVSGKNITELKEMAILKGIKIVKHFNEIMPDGLKILELYHWSYDTKLALEQPFKKLALELGASITTSSDFHGPTKYGEHKSRMGTGIHHNILGTFDQVKTIEGLK